GFRDWRAWLDRPNRQLHSNLSCHSNRSHASTRPHNMIRLHNIERSYPLGRGQLFYVLRDIDFDIAAGDFVSVMGPSGAGKSTLLLIFVMHDHGWTGEYFFDESEVHRL